MFYWWQLMLGFTISIVFSVVAFYFDKDVCDQLIKQPDIDMDMETCMNWYIQTATSMVIMLAISCLIDVSMKKVMIFRVLILKILIFFLSFFYINLQLHFCMAVWAYYQRLKIEKQYGDI